MSITNIEWTATVQPDGSVTPGRVWNPVTGCTKVSQGCKHCYAETLANRFWATQYPPVHTTERERERGDVDVDDLVTRPRRFTDVLTHEDRLLEPLRWRKPCRVFVNSMSDLFHEDVPDEFIDRVFSVMALARRHAFLVLTKRPERMRQYMTGATRFESTREQTINGAIWSALGTKIGSTIKHGGDWRCAWPLPNVWLGVSVEDQATADARIPLLLQTPAAIRFVSYEPALGPVDFSWMLSRGWCPEHDFDGGGCSGPCAALEGRGHRLHWVIVGGESGKGARPFNIEWARSVVCQGRAAGVPVFVKQIGAVPVCLPGTEGEWPASTRLGPTFIRAETFSGRHLNLRDRKGGDPAEWPEDLRVREWPR